MSTTVGIFGLGLVGMALAGRFLRAGRQVVGYDPDWARAGLLGEAGGDSAVPARVWQQDLVFSCVFDTDQLAELIDQAPVRNGATLVSASTCDPLRIPDLGAAASAKGWHLVEAAISGTSKQLAAGDAVFLVGGDQTAARSLAPVLAALGRSQHHVGPLGSGNRAKLAVNLVLGLNRAALAEGLVFAQRLGLAPEGFLDLLQDTAAASAVMKTKGGKMVARDFAAQGRVEQSAKDFGLILNTAAGKGQNLPFARVYAEMMQNLVNSGEAELDNAAILLAIERAKGI